MNTVRNPSIGNIIGTQAYTVQRIALPHYFGMDDIYPGGRINEPRSVSGEDVKADVGRPV